MLTNFHAIIHYYWTWSANIVASEVGSVNQIYIYIYIYPCCMHGMRNAVSAPQFRNYLSFDQVNKLSATTEKQKRSHRNWYVQFVSLSVCVHVYWRGKIKPHQTHGEKGMRTQSSVTFSIENRWLYAFNLATWTVEKEYEPKSRTKRKTLQGDDWMASGYECECICVFAGIENIFWFTAQNADPTHQLKYSS